MAEVITRFKLETSQFDSKLRDASKGMAELVKHLSIAGKDFDKFAQSSIEQARALGKIESGATNLKDKLKDLVGAYNDVARQYNILTEEQKKGEFGKALSGSLQELQGRIRDTKAEMNAVPGVLDKLSSKFTINVDAVKLFSVGLNALQGAVGVAKDAFFASEQHIDEWGKVVESSKAIYEGFLISLNTGDIGGFLSNIAQIEKAARSAYDALDQLNTMKTIDTPALSGNRTEISRLETMLRTGRAIDSLTGGKSYGTAGEALSKDMRDAVSQDLKNLVKSNGDIIVREIKTTNDAIDKLYEEQALTLGMSKEEFRKGTATWEAFERNMQMSAKYAQYEREHTSSGSMSTGWGSLSADVRDKSVNPYAQYKNWAVFKDDGAMYQRIVQEIQKRDSLQQQYLGEVGRAYRGVNRVEGNPYTGGRTPQQARAVSKMETPTLDRSWQSALEGPTMTKAEIEALARNIRVGVMPGDIAKQLESLKPTALGAAQHKASSELSAEQLGIDSATLQTILKDALQNGIDTTSLNLEPIAEQIAEGVNVEDEQWQGIIDKYNEMREAIGEKPIEINIKTGKKELEKEAESIEKSWSAAASAVSSIGSALTQIEDPAAKVMGIIAQAIATVALTFAKSLKGTVTPWDWIAAAAAGTATMVSTIAAIKSATAGNYAEGGIVPGNNYNGDRLTANVNSGELILNRAQQDALAPQLQAARTDVGTVREAYVRGDVLYLALGNYLDTSGKKLKKWI